MSKYVVRFQDENIKVQQIIEALQSLATPIVITLESDEAVEHLRALDRWKCGECGDINDNSMKVCECGAANPSGK